MEVRSVPAIVPVPCVSVRLKSSVNDCSNIWQPTPQSKACQVFFLDLIICFNPYPCFPYKLLLWCTLELPPSRTLACPPIGYPPASPEEGSNRLLSSYLSSSALPPHLPLSAHNPSCATAWPFIVLCE